MVIGKDQNNGELQCLCDFDPHSLMSYKVTWWHIGTYDIDEAKFDGVKACAVTQRQVYEPVAIKPTKQINQSDPGGINCKLCKRFYQYAEVNRDDDTMVCYKCRQTKGYLLKCHPIK